MVIVVGVQAMNITDMLVAWSFEVKQTLRVLMTDEEMMLLTTARTPTPRADGNLDSRPAPLERENALRGLLIKRVCIRQGRTAS